MMLLTSTAGKMIKGTKGYTYLMMMVAAASLGIIAVSVGAVFHARETLLEKEEELIFRGMSYAKAIQSYYEAVPGKKELPVSLENLAYDSRLGGVKHIRSLYKDPIYNEEWELILTESARICGVVSKNPKKPIKRKGFNGMPETFENAESYRDWKFLYNLK